ncbi:MAG: biotin/lipoyl-binding carrier protein [Acidimicrobiales bacterium]|jgi:acetyl-CoA carboxylase biotin carboxyl carrier protein
MSEEINSQLVATVWKILVSENQYVSAGDTLMILESMKMEIPITAERDGIVVRVVVTEGQTVQGGDLLIKLD